MNFNNHIFRTYDEDNNVISSFIIKDRTKHEAENEAMRFVESCDPNVSDWTVTTAVERSEALQELNIQDTPEYDNDCLINDIAEKFDTTVEVVNSFKEFNPLQ